MSLSKAKVRVFKKLSPLITVTPQGILMRTIQICVEGSNFQGLESRKGYKNTSKHFLKIWEKSFNILLFKGPNNTNFIQ